SRLTVPLAGIALSWNGPLQALPGLYYEPEAPRSLLFWDEQFRPVHSLPPLPGIDHLAFSPDGRRLVVAFRSGELLAWPWPRGTARPLKGPGARITSLVLSADSKFLAAADEKGNVALHDIVRESKPRWLKYAGPGGVVRVHSLALAADGKT